MKYKYLLQTLSVCFFSMAALSSSAAGQAATTAPSVDNKVATPEKPAATTTPATPAAADTPTIPAKYKIALALGFDEGGETLMSGVYSSGAKWDIRSNTGMVARAGLIIPTSDFETQIMLGYKSDSTSASNGKVSFSNIQLDVIESYHPNDFRIGLGMAYITSTQFEVDVPGGTTNGTYKFKDTPAGVVQIGWAPRDKIYSIDLRYTVAKFTPSNFTTSSFAGAKAEYSGNVIGLTGGLSF